MLDYVSENRYSNPVAGFTKLFSSLIFSTVWREEMHVKVVWITMLAMANRNGDVLASVPGLAIAAGVSLEQTQEALARLASPDPFSRTKDNEGRRICEVDGGWTLLNYPKYREIRDADERRIQTRENVRAFRERKAKGITVSKVSRRKPRKAQAEAEAEAEEKTSAPTRGDSWLSPYAAIWHSTYGGSPSFGKIAKFLRPLHDADARLCLRRWENYVLSTDAGYASPSRFAETFGSWDSVKGKNGDGRVSAGEARDAYAAKGLNPLKVPANGFTSRAALDRALEGK